jgi:long-chain fatty acid transport protein
MYFANHLIASEQQYKILRTSMLVAVLMSTSNVFASAWDAYGFGSRNIAMGNAATSSARGVSAAYYNPGALSLVESLELDISVIASKPQLTLDGNDFGTETSRGTALGFVVPGKLGGGRGLKFSYALATYLPHQRMVRVKIPPADSPRFTMFDNRTQRLIVNSHLAFQVLENLHFGLGANFLASTEGKVEIEGTVIADPEQVEQSSLESAVDIDLTSIKYFSAGLLYYVQPHWHMGLAFRDEFVLEVNLDAKISGDVNTVQGESLVNDAVFQIISANRALFSPRQLSFGNSYVSRGGSIFALDLIWQQWSRYPHPLSAPQVEFDLGNLSSLVDVPTVAPLDAPGFNDILIVRFGAEIPVMKIHNHEFRARFGYQFEPTPVPNQSEVTNYMDANKHVLSMGLGVEGRLFESVLSGPLGFDLHAQFIQLESRLNRKASPTDVYGSYRHGGRIFSVGVGLHYVFEEVEGP